MAYDRDEYMRVSNPILGKTSEICSVAANAVGGTAELLNAELTTAGITGLGTVVGILFVNPSTAAASIWLRDIKADLAAADTLEGIEIQPGEKYYVGVELDANDLYMENAHKVFLAVFKRGPSG